MHKRGKTIAVITDNTLLMKRFVSLNAYHELQLDHSWSWFSSSGNTKTDVSEVGNVRIRPIKLRDQYGEIIERFDLVISLHCNQIFPPQLVRKVRCINIHPGLNPHNRGWYPQVFGILNQLPCGATIHEMDEEVDHGPVIARAEVEVSRLDFSIDVYERVIDAEFQLIERWLRRIVDGDYTTFMSESDGNYNSKADFRQLCRIDLEQVGSFRDFLDIIRALSHPPYWNAYVEEGDERVYIRLEKKKANGN